MQSSLLHRLCRGLLTALLTLAPVQAVVHGADRALLVGINDYRDERINDLRGCENDAETLRRVLVDDYGFAEGDIRSLRSGEGGWTGEIEVR